MKYRKGLHVLLVIGALLVASTVAMADGIDPWNSRPVTVNPAPSGEVNLSVILTNLFGYVPSQHTAGEYSVAYPTAPSFSPHMYVEWAGYAGSNIMGIWSGTDTGSISFLPVFKGAANSGTAALLVWDTSSGLLSIIGNPSKVYTVIDFAGISPTSFGFYLQGPGTTNGLLGKFWSVDALNPGGLAQVLAYRDGATTNWAFAFEDVTKTNGADYDYNDMVVKVESLVPVPEPATLTLLGTGLIGLAGLVRRKFKK